MTREEEKALAMFDELGSWDDGDTWCDHCDEPHNHETGEIAYFPEEDIELCDGCQVSLNAGFCYECEEYKTEMVVRDFGELVCVECDMRGI